MSDVMHSNLRVQKYFFWRKKKQVNGGAAKAVNAPCKANRRYTRLPSVFFKAPAPILEFFKKILESLRNRSIFSKYCISSAAKSFVVRSIFRFFWLIFRFIRRDSLMFLEYFLK